MQEIFSACKLLKLNFFLKCSNPKRGSGENLRFLKVTTIEELTHVNSRIRIVFFFFCFFAYKELQMSCYISTLAWTYAIDTGLFITLIIVSITPNQLKYD